MRAKIRNKYDDTHSITVHLPAAPMALYDMLDRLGADNKFGNVYINIEDESIPQAMHEGGFYDDIFKLNLLAERLGGLDNCETAAFTAILSQNEEYNLRDVILVTYGVQTLPVYPCSNYSELGEIVIDNDMIPEVENCPEEYIEFLDPEKVGELAAERNGGVFINGYYCEIAGYEQPDIEITIGKPSRNEFQILIGSDEKTAQWYTLPYTDDMVEKHIFDIRSPLPNIKIADDISKLNEVAEKVAELDRQDLIKLKTVMESNLLRGSGGALSSLETLNKYEFDNSVRICADYGRKYMSRQLPDNFDMNILNLSDVGSRILERKGGTLTSYGALSGIGQELYSAINVNEESEDMEIDEDCEQEMGVI